MEKRAYERIPVNIPARFFYGNMFFAGSVRNLSEKGMYISTDTCLPEDSFFTIIVREEKRLMKVIAKVRRNTKTGDFFDGMGIELLSPSVSYLKYVDSLKAAVY